MIYTFGIDNSSLTHSVYIISEDEKKIKLFTIENNLKGFNKLEEYLIKYPDHIVGFELPHGPIIDFFREKNYTSIYSINPLKIKRFKQTTNVSGNKDDNIDSYAIALYLKRNINRINPMIFNSSMIEELNLCKISHERLTREHVRYLNKLRYIVNQYFPLMSDLFSNFGCKVLLYMILEYPTWSDLQKTSDENIISFLYKNKYRVKRNVTKVLKKIHAYDQISNKEIEAGFSIEVKALVNILLILKQNLKLLEERMEIILQNHSLGPVFKSLPGSGTVLAGKLLAIFGDNKDRFNKYSDVQCLYGTAPMNYSSGKYSKVMMRKACNKVSRSILYQYAFSSLRFSSWAREYYDEQRKKGKTHSVAVRALSNKWVKIIFSMWKNNTRYNEKIYVSKENKKVA